MSLNNRRFSPLTALKGHPVSPYELQCPQVPVHLGIFMTVCSFCFVLFCTVIVFPCDGLIHHLRDSDTCLIKNSENYYSTDGRTAQCRLFSYMDLLLSVQDRIWTELNLSSKTLRRILID